ncbi:MAG: tagaturonate epimerase family protein [Trueperaceae bacterium]
MEPRPAALDVALRHGRQPLANTTRQAEGLTLWAERDPAHGWRLAAAASDPAHLTPLVGTAERVDDHVVLRGPADPANAAALRALLPNLRPAPLGLATSAGFGDRLGLGTPGHVDALFAVGAVGADGIAPIFAQQSVRENTRTGRTPREVLDDATLGAFLAGWSDPVGADADHLKSEVDVDAHLEAGFSFFTIDPGDHVVSEADALDGAALAEAFEQRPPWAALDSDPADLLRRLSGTTVDLGDRPLRFAPGELERAAVKYGGALAHVARLARHLRGQAGPERAELEVSVDETETPTTLAEHAYLAIELRRLGVDWVSLAPRFVGAFEKGVDYIGDLGALTHDLDGHARVAAALGPYKLSLHSGSDKFAVYPIAVAAAGGLVHLKTAGTSYLEALRVAGRHDPELLHAVMRLGLERFAEDVKSYHISGRPEGVPDLAALPGTAALALLEQTDARQVLHVTFGSALRRYGEPLKALLRAHPDDYRAALRRHFERHLAPFVGAAKGGAT